MAFPGSPALTSGGVALIDIGAFDMTTHGAFSYEEKVAIALIYEQLKEGNPQSVTAEAVAATAQCSVPMALQVMSEVDFDGSVLDPATGAHPEVGLPALSEYDEQYLHWLQALDPSRTLASYQSELFHQTGTFATTFIIFQWLHSGLNYTTPLPRRQPFVVPSDSLFPPIIMLEFLWTVGQIDPRRLKFGSESSLKGVSIATPPGLNKSTKGATPAVPLYLDSHRKYTALGLVGIDTSVPAMYFWLHNKKSSKKLIQSFFHHAVASGWLHAWDVLVLDSHWTNKLGKSCVDMENWLWHQHRIFVLHLQGHAVPWNPTFHVWKAVVQRLRMQLLAGHPHPTRDFCARSMLHVMNQMTHNVVFSSYRQCRCIP